MIASSLQAMDRLPSLVQEISMIGCVEVPCVLENSCEDSQPLTMTMKNNHADLPPLRFNKEKMEIKDYPRPLGVVGVSVLYVLFPLANFPLSFVFLLENFPLSLVLSFNKIKIVWHTFYIIYLSF